MFVAQWRNLLARDDPAIGFSKRRVRTLDNHISVRYRQTVSGLEVHASTLIGYQAPIIPIVDFNGDGKVDAFEVSKMADHWGTDDSLCDIGPFAWGDGIVDVEDLKVLAEYIGEPVDDSTLVAHWALDETEGMVAADSAGDHRGTVSPWSGTAPIGCCTSMGNRSRATSRPA